MNGLNAGVTNIEHQSFSQDLVAGIQQLNVKERSLLPIRPAYGTQGDKILLWANYFEMLPNKSKIFHRYDVSMTSERGEAPTGKKLQRCVRILLQQLPHTIPIASDYSKFLITAEKLPFEQRQFSIQYFSEGEGAPNNNSPRYRANVQRTGSFSFGDLIDYLNSTDLFQDKPAAKDEIIQATNIIIGSGMKSNPQMITKRNKYFPTGGNLGMLTTGLLAFRGFFMSVRAATGRVLLNVQVQHAVVWESQLMSVLLSKLASNRMDLSEVSRFISGVTVEVVHLNNRIKRVAGLALVGDGRGVQPSPKIKCSYANATQVQFWRTQPAPAKWITVADHFKEIYQPLRNPEALLINVGSRAKPVYFPSELCRIKSLQTYEKMLSPEATEILRRHAVRAAPDNARTNVNNGLNLLRDNCKTILGNFNITVNPSMITVAGRILPGVAVQYAGKAAQPRDGGWNMQGMRFHTPAKVLPWIPLWIKLDGRGGDFQYQSDVDVVVGHLHKTLLACGMTSPEPPKAKVLALRSADDLDSQIHTVFKQMVHDNFKLILIILPNKSTTVYNAVKRVGDIKCGIHTIGVVAGQRQFCRGLGQQSGYGVPNVQYHANVALKFNLKSGGRNQVLRDADLSFIGEGNTMVVGLDVTHPAAGSAQTAPSVSSITASVDRYLAQWPADVAIQTGRQEMIDGLKNMMKSRLALWREKNRGRLPDEILFYRDGVGEGMYELVRSQELPLIREACREVYPANDTKANKPYITVIICGKRHHTRFYPTKEADADPRTGGTRNGTIVDRGVTEARVWDFYFQAHTALQGTPRSAHYVVVHDEIFRRRALAKYPGDKAAAGREAADNVESLTNALSYTFGRATKAVSLCPPAYYADIACERARAWLSGVFDEQSLASSQAEVRDADVQVHANLKDTMFYI